MDPSHDPVEHDGMARGPRPGVPRWVKVFGLIALGLIVLLVVIMMLLGGEHGPGLHASAAVLPPGTVTEALMWQ